MTKKHKKRFIAGATCPECKQVDTLMLYFENEVEKLACVTCDYQSSQLDSQTEQSVRPNENVIGLFKP